jgi:hypothetical protein
VWLSLIIQNPQVSFQVLILDMEKIPFPTYSLLEQSHALVSIVRKIWACSLCKHLCNACGCLQGLYETIYNVVTKSRICLQHCCTSSSISYNVFHNLTIFQEFFLGLEKDLATTFFYSFC